MDIVIFSFVTAFGITFLSIPSIIHIAEVKNLYDEPGERKSHSKKIPTLGGIAIFAGVIFSITFWTDFSKCWNLQHVIAAMMIIAFIGVKDDITGLSAFKKLIGQTFAAMILVIWGDIRISSMFGIFGVGEIPYIFSILFSILTILVIINSFNMIDGINGLSGSFGVISSFAFGVWFYMIEDYQHAIVAVSLIGALVAFLRFNISPAKIFMGDTGSMMLGLMLSVFAIEFIQTNIHFTHVYAVKAAPVVAIGTLAIPLFDLVRVFAIRIMHGRSPFKPDRSHLHHVLLDLGCTHNFATFVLSFLAIVIIILTFLLQFLGNYILGAIILLILIIFSLTISWFAKKRQKQLQ
ncbi:MAG: MraY family glycosyltransferase [Bacteroidota bacterium]